MVGSAHALGQNGLLIDSDAGCSPEFGARGEPAAESLLVPEAQRHEADVALQSTEGLSVEIDERGLQVEGKATAGAGGEVTDGKGRGYDLRRHEGVASQHPARFLGAQTGRVGRQHQNYHNRNNGRSTVHFASCSTLAA